MRTSNLLVLLSITFWVACDPQGTDSGEGDLTNPTIDADGDGYSELVDCDDENAAIHPDAVEACNDIDWS
jgi:hypothetical protein